MDLQPFNQHGDQEEWAALTLELMEDGVHPNDAGAFAAQQLAGTLAYANDWDVHANQTRRRRRQCAIAITALALLVVLTALTIYFI